MNVKITSYVDRLKAYYKKWGDKESIERVDSFLDGAEKLREDIDFMEIPRVAVAVKAAKERYMEKARKLMTDRKMTDQERALVFIDMDWALWYLKNLGANPEKEENAMIEILEREMIANELEL